MQADKQTLMKQIKNYSYSPDAQIGKGFSSIVYKGHNISNQTPVAIKVIDTKGIKNEVQHMLLRNEIKALKMLQHENVIHTFEVCQTANNVYIITELCQSKDLGSLIKERGPLPEEQALQLLKQIMKGLQHIHSKGIIHRDVKSANILIKNGVLKIADFGFADFVSEKQSQAGFNVGSPLYMSPEAYKRTQYSQKSDCWAAGVILYEMFIGDQPFKGFDYNKLIQQVASSQVYKNLKISGFAKMLLSRLLSIDVQRRLNASEFLNLLRSNQPKIMSETIMRPVSQTNAREIPSSSSNLNYVFQSKIPSVPKQQEVSKIVSVINESKIPVSPSAVKKLSTTTHPKSNSQLQQSPKKLVLGAFNRLSTETAKHTSYLADKIENLKVLYTCCEILKENVNLPKVFVLCVRYTQQMYKQLQESMKVGQNITIQEKAMLKQHIEKVNQMWARTNVPQISSNDPYFNYILTSVNPQTEIYTNYAKFWLRYCFEILKQALKTDKINLQLHYNSCLYGAKFYQIADNRGESNRVAQNLLDRLLKDISGPSAGNMQTLVEATRLLTV